MININNFRNVIKNNRCAEFDGMFVDIPAAMSVVYVYDRVNQSNQMKFLSLPINKMIAIARSLMR